MTEPQMTEDNKLLYYIKKWTEISPEDEPVILSAFEPCSIRKKENLPVSGKTCKYLYFITIGCLRSYYIDSKGTEHIYQIRMDNSWISYLESFFTQSPSKYNIEALEDTLMLRISFQRLSRHGHKKVKLTCPNHRCYGPVKKSAAHTMEKFSYRADLLR